MNVSVVAILIGVVAVVLSPILQIWLGAKSYEAGAAAYLLVLPLLSIGLLALMRLRRIETGILVGTTKFYVFALLYPVVLIGGLAIFANAMGGGHPLESISLDAAAKQIAIMASASVLAALITEELFFRGALWGVCVRANWSRLTLILWTTMCFAAWHAAIPFVDQNYQVPLSSLPVFLINVFLIGLAWAILRLVSNSVFVPAVGHGVWNGLSYVLFGYGSNAGMLGIEDFGFFGPERGIAGIAANMAVLVVLAPFALSKKGALGRKT